jgi:hypothetical protein
MNPITASFLAAYEEASQRLIPNQLGIQRIDSCVGDKTYRFHFIHRDHQSYEEVRAYRKVILGSMGLDEQSPAIQIIGDSARFGEDRIAFAKQVLFDVLNKHPKHVILYGLTGGAADVNALVSAWINSDPEKQTRSIGNAVCIHTPMAIKAWGCEVGDVTNTAVVYPDALFGADVSLSDNFVPQYDEAPGTSMGICLEGGAQSFSQVVNMLGLNIPILAVENLRGSTNSACAVNEKFTPHFLTDHFVSSLSQGSIIDAINQAEIGQPSYFPPEDFAKAIGKFKEKVERDLTKEDIVAILKELTLHKYVTFFSASEFLHLIQQQTNAKDHVSKEDVERIRDAYLYNQQVHGVYHFEKHKHLHILANPKRLDYSTKQALFTESFNKFVENHIWDKLELLTVTNCEVELEKRARSSSVAALMERIARSGSPIHSHIVEESSSQILSPKTF